RYLSLAPAARPPRETSSRNHLRAGQRMIPARLQAHQYWLSRLLFLDWPAPSRFVQRILPRPLEPFRQIVIALCRNRVRPDVRAGLRALALRPLLPHLGRPSLPSLVVSFIGAVAPITWRVIAFVTAPQATGRRVSLWHRKLLRASRHANDPQREHVPNAAALRMRACWSC